MSGRGRLAVGILVVWAGTLGWHVKREYFRPAIERIAAAARTLPPGTAYYAVFQGDRRIGWAQTEVDTLPSATGFLLRDRLILREPVVPGGDRMRLAVDARLGPTLALESFRLAAEGIAEIRHVAGEVHGDSVLELRVRTETGSRRERIRLEGPIILSGAWSLRFAAQREVRRDEPIEVELFDPVSGASRRTRLVVRETGERVFPDSMVAEDGRWVAARYDTVRAWKVEQEVAGLTLRSWVDEDGRLVETEAPGGLRLVRTAFELAYFGERVPERGGLAPALPAIAPLFPGEGGSVRPPEENPTRPPTQTPARPPKQTPTEGDGP